MLINNYGHMEKNFYLFRHGETEYNRLRLQQGQSIDIGLNIAGCEQARILAAALKEKQVEIVYSSPLKRAVETAEIVSQSLNVPMKIEPGFIEGNFGVAEGLHAEVVCQKWPEIINNWSLPSADKNLGFPGGESKAQICARIQQAMNKLVEMPQNHVAISSHSGVLRLLLMELSGVDRSIPNAKVIEVLWRDGYWKIV